MVLRRKNCHLEYGGFELLGVCFDYNVFGKTINGTHWDSKKTLPGVMLAVSKGKIEESDGYLVCLKTHDRELEVQVRSNGNSPNPLEDESLKDILIHQFILKYGKKV